MPTNRLEAELVVLLDRIERRYPEDKILLSRVRNVHKVSQLYEPKLGHGEDALRDPPPRGMQTYVSKNGRGKTVNVHIAAWRSSRRDYIVISSSDGDGCVRRIHPDQGRVYQMFDELLNRHIGEQELA